MNSIRLIVIALACLFITHDLVAQDEKAPSSPPQPQPQPKAKKEFPKIADMLPKKRARAVVLQARSNPEIAAITKKLQASVAVHAEWFKAYVRANVGKTPLPYHEKFGVTEEEYKTLTTSGDQFRLVKVGEINLDTKWSGNTVELILVNAHEEVQPLVFDLVNGTLKTPMATIPKAVQRDSGKQGGLLGHHMAYSWQTTLGDPNSGTFSRIVFTLGRLSKTGSTFIQYQVSKMKESKPDLQFQALLIVSRDQLKGD